MIHPLVLLAATGMIYLLGYGVLGYPATYQIGYGAFMLLAAMISGTFLWLWFRRATPLAIGMAFSWAGAASVMGWWWLYNLLGAPSGMQGNPGLFILLSVYFSGAIMHFAVIERSFGSHGYFYVVAPVIAIALSAAIYVGF